MLSNQMHIFPESRKHHLNHCWCSQAKEWRAARDNLRRIEKGS